MKSYNHLWETFMSQSNIDISIVKAAIGKKKRKDVKRVMKHPEEYRDKAKNYAENFHNCKHTPIKILDGSTRKEREIIVPKFKEQIIHHMVVNTMMPIFMKGMYKHSYASIPKRGAHKARKVIEKWIKHDPKNCKYCLKLDIKKFFNSIDHDVLKEKIRKCIHDKRFLKIVLEIVDATDKGIPLGFYTSQWFANWLLQSLDHYIKEKLHVKHYARYMDDMVLFGANKRKLHKVHMSIEKYLRDELHLKLKENWQLFRFDYTKNGKRRGRFLDFMGFRFYRDKVTLRKNIMIKMSRKAKKIYKKGYFTIHDARQIISYIGWLDYTDTYQMYIEHVAPYINCEDCKAYISKYDRKHMHDNDDNLKEAA